MKIGNIVYAVDPFLLKTRRCKIIGEEEIGLLKENTVESFWKTKDSIDGSINYACKNTTFDTIEEANTCVEKMLDKRFEKLVEETDTKEKLLNYLYALAKVNETDNKALDYLEKEIKKHTDVEVS